MSDSEKKTQEAVDESLIRTRILKKNELEDYVCGLSTALNDDISLGLMERQRLIGNWGIERINKWLTSEGLSASQEEYNTRLVEIQLQSKQFATKMFREYENPSTSFDQQEVSTSVSSPALVKDGNVQVESQQPPYYTVSYQSSQSCFVVTDPTGGLMRPIHGHHLNTRSRLLPNSTVGYAGSKMEYKSDKYVPYTDIGAQVKENLFLRGSGDRKRDLEMVYTNFNDEAIIIAPPPSPIDSIESVSERDGRCSRMGHLLDEDEIQDSIFDSNKSSGDWMKDLKG